MLYYISGDDTFNKNKYVNKIVAGKEVINIDMATCDYSNVMSMMLSVDLFAEPKVYIFEGFKGFSNKSEKYSKANIAILDQIFKCDETIVLLCDKPLNRDTTWYGKFGTGIEAVEFNLEQLDYETALETFIADNHIQITSDALDVLKLNFPNNIFGATNDLLKIWEYTDHQQIGEDDVKAAGQILVEHKIFELYNLIILGRTKQAITYLEIIRNEGISDSDVLLVSFTQIKRMYETKVLIAKGYTDFKIAAQIKISPYAAKQNRKILAHVSNARLEKIVQMLADFDYQFKSGTNTPTNLVDQLVIS
ncbi:hypothetical protein RZE82_03600 [Mollicutes bacterium LVI A0039]|nr:hypothetical protein RZE82_03600 [Mollicutes bacterium LVI A0039]